MPEVQLVLPKNPPKLPKAEHITRQAVIHIRGSGAKPPVGRIMVKDNLKHVTKSIVNANKVADVTEDPRFTHIMLYGDFDYAEVPSVIALVRKEVGLGVEVLFVSSPWELREWTVFWPNPVLVGLAVTATLKELKHNKEKVDELWKKFRHFDSDFLPVQVKTLAVWTALCERYHPNVYVIGHRSGFVESAGLVGIPIFYLNNERRIIDKANKGSTKAGDLLWQPVKKPTDVRELADVMNTFIPIKALERKELAINEVLRVDKRNWQPRFSCTCAVNGR